MTRSRLSSRASRLTGHVGWTAVLGLMACQTPTIPGPPPFPTVPSAPNLPTTPNLPTVPNAPDLPGLPNAPTAPTAPTAPEGHPLVKWIKDKSGKGGVYVTCQTPPLEIFIQAEERVNLNEAGQSMPVEVRALLLRSRTVFDTLDFETLWQQAPQALGGHLAGSASLTVYPGKLKIYPIKSSPEVAFVALVAIFRKPDANGWKHVVDVRQQNQRCGTAEDLHTIVHALVRGNRIGHPD